MTKLETAKLNIHAINNAARLEVRANGGTTFTVWEYEAWLDEISQPTTPSTETFELTPTK